MYTVSVYKSMGEAGTKHTLVKVLAIVKYHALVVSTGVTCCHMRAYTRLNNNMHCLRGKWLPCFYCSVLRDWTLGRKKSCSQQHTLDFGEDVCDKGPLAKVI